MRRGHPILEFVEALRPSGRILGGWPTQVNRRWALQRQQLSSNRARILLKLQQVPFVTVQVFENCDRSVRFLAWFLVELYISRFHFNVVPPEIVGMQKKKDSPSGLVANTTDLFGC